jgi:replicative DNA helicase
VVIEPMHGCGSKDYTMEDLVLDLDLAELTPRLVRPGDLLGEWDADVEAAYAARRANRPRGPVTGLPKLDDALGGALAPGLHEPHGGPGAGKSALLWQIAATCGFPCLFVTCEMGPLELLRRLTARVTGTHLRTLKAGDLDPSKAKELARRAVREVTDLVIVDATRAFAAPEWLRRAAEVARGDSEHLLLALDSIHTWADGAPVDVPEYERVSAAVDALRTLAAELSCPILAVTERNRASMQSGGLSAGAGSRKLEYAAESVWDLQRDPEALPDAAGEVPVTLRLAKNRNGAAGHKIALRFHGGLQRFREA